MDWEKRCKELQQRIEELERENQELRRQLGYAEPVRSVVTEIPKNEMVLETAAGIHMRSTPEEKIRLFRSLFRGREDVFARRWYSVQKGKGGYDRSVPTSGDTVFASSRKVSVPRARTGCWYRWMMP